MFATVLDSVEEEGLQQSKHTPAFAVLDPLRRARVSPEPCVSPTPTLQTPFLEAVVAYAENKQAEMAEAHDDKEVSPNAFGMQAEVQRKFDGVVSKLNVKLRVLRASQNSTEIEMH